MSRSAGANFCERATSGEIGEIEFAPREIIVFVAGNVIRRVSCLQGTPMHEEEPELPCFARFVGVIQLISRNSGRRFLPDGFHSEA